MSAPTTPTAFTPILKGAKLREMVTERLMGAILSGEMPPGSVYSAPVLAEQFGVSSTPVREAMVELLNKGLVVALPNKGFRVTEPTDQELDDLADVRLYLEPPATRDALAHLTPEHLPRLRSLADDISAAAQACDLAEYMRADRAFHAAVLGLLDNDRLVKLCTSLRAQTRLFGLHSLAEQGKLEHSAREHHELLDLGAAGDLDGAEALMRRHLGHTRGLWAFGEDRPGGST